MSVQNCRASLAPTATEKSRSSGLTGSGEVGDWLTSGGTFNSDLVPKPAGENWGKDQGGYTICSSKDPKKCAFYIEPTKEKGQSPAEQLKKFKSS